jgi:DNA-binding transcriptional ArsR family regulator
LIDLPELLISSEKKTSVVETIASPLPQLDQVRDQTARARIRDKAQIATDVLKSISHEGRLLILCSLAHGERSVTELETMLGTRQSAISQQLARLRQDGIVAARRDGKQIFYRLTDDRVRRVIESVYELYCA